MVQLTDDDRKKRYGQYFSGKNVANTLAGLIPGGSTIKTAIDPMVGNGDMLESIIGLNPLIEKICGIDIDPLAVLACQDRIPDAEIFIGSAFERDEVLCERGWDLVITNPPYVRYQLLNSNEQYGLPSGEVIRENLKTMILKATFIDEDERSLLLKIANEYSGLADLAVPSWILCALITKKQGYLAMVVPETWLNRDYALPIHYLLIKAFDVLTIVKDVDSVWFDNASVRTCLVIAKKRDKLLTYDECNGHTYVIEVGKTLLGSSSVVEKFAYGGAEREEALKRIINKKICIKESGIEGDSIETKQLFYNLVMHLNEMNWVLESDKKNNCDDHILPNELISVIQDNIELQTIEEMGWRVGQGLRTGANEFFYANILDNDECEEMVKVKSRSWHDCEFLTDKRNIRITVQNRNEVQGLCVRKSSLKKCIFYLNDAITKSDEKKLAPEKKDLYRILDAEIESYIRSGEEYIIPKKEKRYSELSAVKTNEKKDKKGFYRFWYMLPKLQRRHQPQLCISRLCGKEVECLYIDNDDCSNDRIVVDANFITLWNESPLVSMEMFALLNSSWFKCYMEIIGTRMGGGALKIEASHLRQVLFPKLTLEMCKELSQLGLNLKNDNCDFESTRAAIDKLLYGAFGKDADVINHSILALLEKKLRERGVL